MKAKRGPYAEKVIQNTDDLAWYTATDFYLGGLPRHEWDAMSWPDKIEIVTLICNEVEAAGLVKADEILQQSATLARVE